MFVQPFYFVSYYVSYYVYCIEYDDYFFFQETYNNRLRERYGDDTLSHPEFDPDLWMEVGSSGEPDKNRVYGLSNTTANNLRSTRSVSTVGSFQSILSSQSKEFVALQQLT
jgi:3-deoxy-D-manno-octulosonic-acid transferase